MAVIGTNSVGVGRTDSRIGEGCVDYCVGSVLLLFGVGSFCNFCGNLRAFYFILGWHCDVAVFSTSAFSGIGSDVRGMGTESREGISSASGIGA